MASKLPTDLHRRYKIGTNHVVKWLSTTVTRCTDAAATVPRLEKARKHKKHSSKSKPKPKSTTRSAAVVTKVTSHDLLELSHALTASAKTTDGPPEGITDAILVLEDVIAGRKECAMWYARKSVSEDLSVKQTDASHSAFVRILLQVLAQLKTVLQKSKAILRSARETGDSRRGCTLANIYQALYVDEEQHDLDGTHAHPKQSSAAFELEVDPVDEKAFALWCFLQECYQVRQHVKAAWVAQQDRAVPGMVASQISTCATLLMSHRASSFAAEYPDLATFDLIANFLDIKATLSGLNILDFSCNEQGLDNQDTPQTSTADLVCLQAMTGLNVLRYHKEAETDGDTRRSYTYLAAAHPLFRTIAECMPEIQALHTEKGRLAACGYGDAFTQLLIDTCVSPMRSHSRMELQLVVGLAFQMQLDILDAIGPNSDCEYVQFTRAMEDITESLQLYQSHVNPPSHASELGIILSKSSTRKALRRRTHRIRSPPRDAKAAETFIPKDDGKSYISPLFARSPSLVNHITWSLLQAKRLDAMETVNLDLALKAMVHLYQACRTVGRLKLTWDDLDFMVAQQSPDVFGLGKLHKRNAFHTAKQFGLAMGIPLRKYSHFRGSKASTGQKPALPSFDAALERMPKVPLSTKFLETLRPFLEGRDRFKGDSSAAQAALHQAAHEVIASPNVEIDGTIRNAWLTCSMLSATQVLEVLEAGMTSEELNMQFDYHQLMAQIYSIFGQLPLLISQIEPNSTAAIEGRMPHEFVHDVLWEAAEAESDGRPLKGIGVISGILECHIQAIGATNLNHAKYILEGDFFPKEVRPTALSGAREEYAEIHRIQQRGLTTTLQGTKLDLATPAFSQEDKIQYAKALAMFQTDPEGGMQALAAYLEKNRPPRCVKEAYGEMYHEHFRREAESLKNMETAYVKSKGIHTIEFTVPA